MAARAGSGGGERGEEVGGESERRIQGGSGTGGRVRVAAAAAAGGEGGGVAVCR